MKLALLTILILLSWQTPLPGQDEQPQNKQAEELMRRGQDAMGEQLWELARHHFQSLLQLDGLSDVSRHTASILLAESMIRDGEPDKALELLSQSHLRDLPETSFWESQALAANGRFAQAVEMLKARLQNEDSTKTPYLLETGMTAASLELALDQPQEALKTLSAAANKLKSPEKERILLRQIDIMLDLGRIDEARELLPEKQEVDPSLHADYAFTEAAILLREKNYEEATRRYQELVENPQNLNLRQHHETWIGWADSLLARDMRSEASELLLDYVQKFPESSQLDKIFKRLLYALPEQPTPSDPILSRLDTWIESAEVSELGLIADLECSAVSAWPSPQTLSDLSTFTLFTKAVGLHRLGTPESRKEADLLLTRLLLEAPTHFLANRTLLMKARWHLDQGESEKAYHLLTTLRETATSPLVKGRAAFQQAFSIAGSGGKPMEATKLYEEASEMLRGIEADTARFNGALIHLIQADALPDKPEDIEDPIIAASLELERALTNTDPTRKQIAIEAFLLAHPDHPRAPEARINAAESALLNQPPDLSSARAQIEALEARSEVMPQVEPARIAMIKLRILDLEEASELAISSARTLIANYPSSSESIEASLILGRHLYQTGNYNDARIVLEKMTGSLTDSHRKQSAWLLAARSAALIPTNQSQQEALALFDKAIAVEGPLSELAQLEKARLMIDMNLLDDAVAYLKPWYDKLAPEDPMRLSAGLLIAEAIYAQGKLNPDSLPQALAIYDKLLETTERFSPENDRIQYLRGLALEQLPDPQLPDQTRDKEALIAYYSVLERDQAPAQWEYFEASGFRALALLEKSRRWPAAIACAKKIASFKGPRAEEAAARANQIQLKYMIWED